MTKLTDKEKLYLSLIKPQKGVLYIQSAPGMAKSAILNSIADKLGWQYIDLRLAQLDPIAVGMFPSTEMLNIDDSNTIKVMDFVVPKWAVLANQRPTLINFDELNRAPDDVLKAAMQIFNERAIGTKFKFNNNVYMAATGNLGVDDGTDVNDLDSALHGRLIHVKHTLSTQEWLEWGKEVLNSTVYNFHKITNGRYLFTTYNKLKDSDAVIFDEASPSPRTWDYLSEYIKVNFGPTSNVQDWLTQIRLVSSYYVGTTAAEAFIKYCKELSELQLSDILNMNTLIYDKLQKFSLDKRYDIFMNIIGQLEEQSGDTILKYSQQELENLNKFFRCCTSEQVAASLQSIERKFTPLQSTPKAISQMNVMFNGFQTLLDKLIEFQSL